MRIEISREDYLIMVWHVSCARLCGHAGGLPLSELYESIDREATRIFQGYVDRVGFCAPPAGLRRMAWRR